MNEIFGSISTDTLPTGYGDEDQISHPTGGTVGLHGFSDVNAVATQGSVSSFGTDADMSGLHGDDYGKLGDKMRGRKTQKKGVEFEGQGGYVWRLFPGQKAVLVSGPGGKPDTEFEAGTATYKQVMAEYEEAGSPQAQLIGGGRKGRKEPMSGQRAANIGTGIGSFFNQVAPTVVGLLGPKQAVDMDFDTGGGESTDLTPTGPSPLMIGGLVVGGIAVLGLVGYLATRSK
jgi:hypothetical protein